MSGFFVVVWEDCCGTGLHQACGRAELFLCVSVLELVYATFISSWSNKNL